jgi:hypothetical protein
VKFVLENDSNSGPLSDEDFPVPKCRCHQASTIGPSPLQASENKTGADLTLQIPRHEKADVKSASSF